MNVLILGGGGREHALAWKIKKSPLLETLFIAPGNAGTSELGYNISLAVDDFNAIANLVAKKSISLVVVGPEAPLVKGIHDFFIRDERLRHVAVFGPDSEGAQLEGSKDWAKNFMEKNQIPTAKHKTFNKDELNNAFHYLEALQPPYVLKADGLAGGKGVVICENLKKAKDELTDMLQGAKFGQASSKVVIEEFLSGTELSVFVITDGKDYKILPAAKDYKRIGEGDTGLNTGGMGSISPVPFANKEFMNKVDKLIIQPTLEGLRNEHIDYRGFIFFGLINVNENPYVIEYNVRMGDPEAESIVPRIKSDLLELIHGATEVTLGNKPIEIDNRFSASVMLASAGYPGKYEKGKIITGISESSEGLVFHAGTKDTGQTETNGGRVLAVTGLAATLKEALDKAYAACETIEFEGKYYRTDLGKDLLKYLK